MMNTEHLIGHKLYDLLQHKTNEDKTDATNTRYNTKVRIYINMHVYKQRGANLNSTNIKNFNNFVERIIKDRYRFVMDFYINIFPSFEANLPYVRTLLGIDDDAWDGDSMKKDYYRYRALTGKPLLYKKKYTVSVPSERFADAAF